MPEALHPTPATSAPSPVRRIFLGPRRLRAGWRLLIFAAAITAFAVLFQLAFTALHVPVGGWAPVPFLITEAMTLAIGLAATAVVSRVDRLPFSAFGLPWRGAFGGRYWEGALWGFLTVAILVGLIAAQGGYHVHGLALHGAELARMTVLWLAVMTLIGLAEEVIFRGYALAALASGIRFWPAAVLLSIHFGAVHYFNKPMENLADALSVGLIGLFLCFTIRRTGTLWFAIGFHFAFDFAALSLFGAPNTGNGGKPVAGYLLDGAFTGPDRLTGGVRGAEASWLIFPLLAVLFVLLNFRYRRVRFPSPQE